MGKNILKRMKQLAATIRVAIFCVLVMMIWSGFVAAQSQTLNVEPMKTNTSGDFPEVSEAAAITSGPKEHLFASYYGINSWSADQRYVTVLETPIKYRLPTENDPAVLGLVDLKTNEFIPLAETRAWNFQQGCMAHWLGTFPNSR
ncbi:MAG: hypothetical protein GY841_16840, partial [FCB group bacterium]|nr:hypothetical protein [FCB group bacterium]